MTTNESPEKLIPYLETVDFKCIQDYWCHIARSVEESLQLAGAVSNVDYNYVDLYTLAQPIVMRAIEAGEVKADPYPYG